MSGLYRPIRSQAADTNTTDNSLQTPENTGSSSNSGRDLHDPKRRKVPESITRNACSSCKKARAKCDGKTPCKRCASRGEAVQCTYEIHVKHAKEELVKQIKKLRADRHLAYEVLEAISADDNNTTEIIDRLKRHEPWSSIVEWLGLSPHGDFETFSPKPAAYEPSDNERSDANLDAIQWTTVAADSSIPHHLLQLYFAWIHPVHTLFHEGEFVKSYQRGGPHCSKVLVNAICSMACHLQPVNNKTGPSYTLLGDGFSDAVFANIEAEDMNLTTIQTFAIMFLVESARGNGLRGSAYLKIATSAIDRDGLQEREASLGAWDITARGIHNLNVEWAQITFHVPPIIVTNPSVTMLPDDNMLDASPWFFYLQASDDVPSWPGLQATTNREKTKLIAIIRDVTTALYSYQDELLSAQHILHLYGRYVTWRDDLPSAIKNIDRNEGQGLPHVVSLLILYSSSVVQLLRPLLQFEGFPSSLVEDIICRHTQKGMYLLDEQYNQRFGCQRQPVLQMFSILHLTDVVTRLFPGGIEGRYKSGPEAMRLALETLDESARTFPVAGTLQELMRRTAAACAIRATIPPEELGIPPQLPKVYHLEDFIDACTRSSYLQPVEEIRRRFQPSFAADWLAHAEDFGFLAPVNRARDTRLASAEELGAYHLMQIRNLIT